MTNHGKILGLLKFIRKPGHVDDLLNGVIYCNTPEYYRSHKDIGVSDRTEACVLHYSKELDISPPTITIDGKEIDLSDAISVHASLAPDKDDSWLQCWFLLYMPRTKAELKELKEDISRVIAEFGSNYVFLPIENFSSYRNKLLCELGQEFRNGPVSYTDDRLSGGMFVKRAEYAYQREYRFALGTCAKDYKEPKILKVGNLRDILSESPKIYIFELDDRCLITNEVYNKSSMQPIANASAD